MNKKSHQKQYKTQKSLEKNKVGKVQEKRLLTSALNIKRKENQPERGTSSQHCLSHSNFEKQGLTASLLGAGSVSRF